MCRPLSNVEKRAASKAPECTSGGERKPAGNCCLDKHIDRANRLPPQPTTAGYYYMLCPVQK